MYSICRALSVPQAGTYHLAPRLDRPRKSSLEASVGNSGVLMLNPDTRSHPSLHVRIVPSTLLPRSLSGCCGHQDQPPQGGGRAQAFVLAIASSAGLQTAY